MYLATIFISVCLQCIKSGVTFIIKRGPSAALLMGSMPLMMAVTVAVIMSPHKSPSRIHGTTALWTAGVALAVTSVAILVRVSRAYKRRLLVAYNIFLLVITSIVINIFYNIEIINVNYFLYYTLACTCFFIVSGVVKLYLSHKYYQTATVLFLCIFLSSFFIPYFFKLNSSNWYSTFSTSKETYFNIIGGGQILVDFFQMSILLIIIIFILVKRDNLRESLSMLTIIDMLLATSRYNSGTDWAVSLGEYWDFLLMPRQEISANFTNNLRVKNFDLNSSWYGLNPGLARWPGITPEMESFDDVFQFSDVYNKLIYFSRNYINISANEVNISAADLNENFNHKDINIYYDIKSTSCLTDNNSRSSINLLNIYSATIIVEFKIDCDYLLIYTDRWSKGWTAELNNIPVNTLKVNNVFRGVIVPAGAHRLVWKYRPAYWHVTKLLFISGVCVVIYLLLIDKITMYKYMVIKRYRTALITTA